MNMRAQSYGSPFDGGKFWRVVQVAQGIEGLWAVTQGRHFAIVVRPRHRWHPWLGCNLVVGAER